MFFPLMPDNPVGKTNQILDIFYPNSQKIKFNFQFLCFCKAIILIFDCSHCEIN